MLFGKARFFGSGLSVMSGGWAAASFLPFLCSLARLYLPSVLSGGRNAQWCAAMETGCLERNPKKPILLSLSRSSGANAHCGHILLSHTHTHTTHPVAYDMTGIENMTLRARTLQKGLDRWIRNERTPHQCALHLIIPQHQSERVIQQYHPEKHTSFSFITR